MYLFAAVIDFLQSAQQFSGSPGFPSSNKVVLQNDVRYGATIRTLIIAIIIFILSIFTPRQTRSSRPRVTGGQIFWQQDTFL